MPVNGHTLAALRVRRMVVEMTGERQRRRKRAPRPRPPSGAGMRYLKFLLEIQRLIEGQVRDVIFPALPDLVAQSRAERPDGLVVVFDATPTDTIERFVDGIRATLGQSIKPAELDIATGDVGAEISNHNAREMDRQIQSVVGIDAVAAEPWLASEMQAFRRENVNLIESIFETELGRMENIMISGQRRGLRVEVLRGQIEKQFGVSRSKAALLARDQTNKLNGQLTGLRQSALGIEEYTWRTSLDDRVREMHRELNGTRHRWDDPPVTNPAGDRNHPGEDYQCRCYADPVIAPLLEAEGTVPGPAAFVQVRSP